jgi:hypothetical protein
MPIASGGTSEALHQPAAIFVGKPLIPGGREREEHVHGTLGRPDGSLLVNLLARLKRALCPVPQRKALQLVVLAARVETTIPLMMAALHEDWNIRFAHSPAGALEMLRKAPSAALVCDWDSHAGDWRGLCNACVQCGTPFHLVAEMPSDDLFLAVAAAGGSGVLWKPLNAEQVTAAIGSARILARTAPDDAQCRA